MIWFNLEFFTIEFDKHLLKTHTLARSLDIRMKNWRKYYWIGYVYLVSLVAHFQIVIDAVFVNVRDGRHIRNTFISRAAEPCCNEKENFVLVRIAMQRNTVWNVIRKPETCAVICTSFGNNIKCLDRGHFASHTRFRAARETTWVTESFKYVSCEYLRDMRKCCWWLSHPHGTRVYSLAMRV